MFNDNDKIERNEKTVFFLAEMSVNCLMVHVQFFYFFRSSLDPFISLTCGNKSVADRFLHYTDICYAQ